MVKTWLLLILQLFKKDMFRAKGRAGRLQFAVQYGGLFLLNWLYLTLAFVALWGGPFLWTGLEIFEHLDYQLNTYEDVRVVYYLAGLTLVGTVIFVLQILAMIRRLHDINRSGWYVLLVLLLTYGVGFFMPQHEGFLLYLSIFLSWLPTLFLVFYPGTVGENRFGELPYKGITLPKFYKREENNE